MKKRGMVFFWDKDKKKGNFFIEAGEKTYKG